MTLPLILAEGTPAEIGASYGEQAAELIAGNLDDYLGKFKNLSGLDAGAVTRAGEKFRATTKRYLPRIADTLDAMAEAAELSVGDIYALNARTELMLPAGLIPPSECTGVAVLPEYTAVGHTLLAQNWDWYPSQVPYALVLATRDERDHRVVALAEAGMPAKAGLNSAGVGVCVNLLGCDRDGVPGGVPCHVLIRAVLDQPDGFSASTAVCSLPRSASINLLIAVSDGTAVDLELAPGLVGRLVPEDGLLTHANHFNSDLGVHDRIHELGGTSLFRDFRARQLLADSIAAHRVSEKDVYEVLKDHRGLPNGICRHVNPADSPELQTLTASSVVMDLNEQRLMVTNGPPCENSYAKVELALLFT